MQYTPQPIPLPGQIFMAADTEDRKAASVTVPQGIAADAIAWLSKLVAEGWRHVALQPLGNPNNRWSVSSTIPGWYQSDVTDGGALFFYLGVPPGGKLVAVEALVDGDAGPAVSGHSAVPASKPDVTVWRVDEGDGIQHGFTQLALVTDSSSTVDAYDSVHEISATGLSETLAQAKAFLVRVRGESGANSSADNLTLLDLRFRVEKAP